ncbi:MAG TPA: SUMF1/EgtB/PvdO family nonheme iron enzyme [Pseudomonadota bacterium]|nr:SUMF1/EgtB/PvdO family nonheme iron enzyme [Pseudomonadota bacterium]
MARAPRKASEPFVAPDLHVVVPDGVAFPLSGLLPDDLAESASRATYLRDEALPPAALRDALVRHLGLGTDFAEYQGAGVGRLTAFLTRHRLTARADLLTPRRGFGRWKLYSRRPIADRLFCSRQPLPQRLFTGYDFDWNLIDYWPHSFDPIFPQSCIAAALGGEAQGRFLEEHWLHFDVALNLLSDILLQPRIRTGVTPCLYHPLNMSIQSRQHDLRMAHAGAEVFRRLIDSTERGWVRLLPYSSGLAFLRGPGGEFEFLVRELRDDPPPAEIRIKHAHPCDLPQSVKDDQTFRRWLYFLPAFWHEMETHLAEHAHYRRGGNGLNYPSFPGVLRLHLEQTARYLKPIPRWSDEPLASFVRQRLHNGRELYVSQLVTIGEFQQFLSASGYAKRRYERHFETDLSAGNSDVVDQPVTANWFDAMAYAAWLERETGRPMRLLRIEEFQDLAPKPPSELHGWQEGTNRGDPLFFAEPIDWCMSRGLRFVLASNIGEWLYEHVSDQAAAVCVRNGLSLHGYCPIHRDFSMMETWGRYKCTKILFRLCYLAAPEVGSVPEGNQ